MLNEIEYYISLGYTKQQAERIASLDFTHPFIQPSSPRSPGFFGAIAQSINSSSVSKRKTSKNVTVAANCVADAMPMEECVCYQKVVEPAISIEDVRTDSYEQIKEQPHKDTQYSPTSTFQTTYNTAAATILIGNFQQNTHMNFNMVRTEELLNYLRYSLIQPSTDLFTVTPELKREGDKGYLFLGIQGKHTMPTHKNIVLLIDTSGSMSSKVLAIRSTIATVFADMHDGDIFSIVTYSDTDHTFINGMKVNKEHNIDYVLDKIKDMEIRGCTYGSKGIETAYSIIEENYIDNGVNRVILVTDGDLNFGITEKSGLKQLIEKKRKIGAYLSCIGTGLYNLMDDKLETLAKYGNGNYFVVNSIEDVQSVLHDRYESLIFPIAKNVKAQVEFNPNIVKGYKLVGFENRTLSHEDFRNDNIVAEPFGSGSYCIACYELDFGECENSHPLRYTVSGNTGNTDELCTLTIRYQNVDADAYNELTFVIPNEEKQTENIERAIECMNIADILRHEDSQGKKRGAMRKYLEMLGLEMNE